MQVCPAEPSVWRKHGQVRPADHFKCHNHFGSRYTLRYCNLASLLLTSLLSLFSCICMVFGHQEIGAKQAGSARTVRKCSSKILFAPDRSGPLQLTDCIVCVYVCCYVGQGHRMRSTSSAVKFFVHLYIHSLLGNGGCIAHLAQR